MGPQAAYSRRGLDYLRRCCISVRKIKNHLRSPSPSKPPRRVTGGTGLCFPKALSASLIRGNTKSSHGIRSRYDGVLHKNRTKYANVIYSIL